MTNTFDSSKYIVDDALNFTVIIGEGSSHHVEAKKWKQVTKEEFNNFIKSYPANLAFDTTGICDPPLSSYNDFSRGNWPDSMDAKLNRNDKKHK